MTARRRSAGRARRLHVARRGDVAELVLPGGELDADLHADLAAAARTLDLDEDVRAVVVSARGRDFCVGGAVVASGAGGAADADGVAALASLRVPVIALLHGRVLDEGLELALACDLRLVAAGARLGLTQVAAGRFPAHGGTQRLPRLVGAGRALHMLLLGETVGARQALAIGLANRVVPRARLRAEGRALASRVAARGPIAQRLGKEALRAAHDLPLAEGLRLEGDLYVLLQTTADRTEGIASFRTRRPPRFAGR